MRINRQILNQFPPFICRMMARTTIQKPRRHVRPLRESEIARRSGLPLPKVLEIAAKGQWDDVLVDDMFRFLKGCGLASQPWRWKQYILRTAGKDQAFRFLDDLPVDERSRISATFVAHGKEWLNRK